VPTDPPPIDGVATGTAGFAGPSAPDTPELLTGAEDFADGGGAAPSALGRSIRGFFDNGGSRAYVAGTLAALDAIDEIALLCPLPEDSEEAIAQCERRRDRVAILSLPAGLGSVEEALAARPPGASAFAGVHHPWVRAGGELTPPGGHVAGLYASGEIGAAPSGREMRGLDDPPLERSLPEHDVAALVEGAVNPLWDLRAAGRGVRVWGARAFEPVPVPDPELRYLPIRRLMIFLETSIERGLGWVAFEPNGEALWAGVRDVVGTFLLTQWRAGRLQGRTPAEAFFVRCDRTTMTQDDLDNGRLICLIGVAAVRPAEFVIFRIGQRTAEPCP
jgi:phage tail sheath protein FI